MLYYLRKKYTRKFRLWFKYTFFRKYLYAATKGPEEIAIDNVDFDHNLIECIVRQSDGRLTVFCTDIDCVFETKEGTDWYYDKWAEHYRHIPNFGGRKKAGD
jgi:hypothetical protein